MPNEQNYNDEQLDLISEGIIESTFNTENGDYIRMSVFDSNDNFKYEFASNKINPDGVSEISIYYDADGNLYVKPNEILYLNYVPSGNYTLRFNFLRDIFSNFLLSVDEAFCSDSTEETSPEEFDEYFSDVEITEESCESLGFCEDTGDDIEASFITDEMCPGPWYQYIFTPREVQLTYGEEARFVITEISPSRKEVRLIARDGDNDIIDINNNFQNEFKLVGGTNNNNDGYDDYLFDYIVSLPQANNIVINNYGFDTVTNENEITLVLRLNNLLPFETETLTDVYVQKELADAYTQTIVYVSNVVETFIDMGLQPDLGAYNSTINDEGFDQYQNYNQLISTGSMNESIIDDIESFQTDEDINLNIDFSKFENHVFFGSAKEKIYNFKSKIGNIQDYLTEMSSSFITSGSHVNNRRKELFGKIRDIKKGFTSYEKFLYTDNQKTATSSAPGIGPNYAFSTPLTLNGGHFSKTLNNFDGFNVVHNHTNSSSLDGTVHLLKDKYLAEERPFFNYSSSIYLSFLLKGDETISSGSTPSDTSRGIGIENNNQNLVLKVPSKALYTASLLTPSITGSEYRRFIYEVSQSHWRPTGSDGAGAVDEFGQGDVQFLLDDSAQFGDGGNNVYYEILNSHTKVMSASMATGSYPHYSGSYPIILRSQHSTLGTNFTGSEVPFTGSIMPAGDYFRLYFSSGSALTSSFITDVKVTKYNPGDALPFDRLYKTGSSIWSDWYDGMYISASNYDDKNIHSLENNLPKIIRDDVNSVDLKKFLNMWGEHFDLTRNYIDNFRKFYDRQYKQPNIMPDNLLPILSDNLGWELINPFSSSLSNYFGGMTGSVISTQNVTHNTWRKQLNNLIYVYKTKGTLNSVRALLNIYGYPPDVISVDEFGGSMEEINPSIINDTITTLKSGLGGSEGNISYVLQPILFSTLNLNGNRKLNLDWWTNTNTGRAKGDGVEFIFKSDRTTNNQILVENSGSATQSLWDVRLISSASSTTTSSIMSKLEFRLNNTETGSEAMTNNSVSMSTEWLPIKGNGKLWNVYLTRLTSSFTETTQSYKLYIGLQNKDKIPYFSATSMSITNISASNNFRGTGSLSNAVSGNLVFGETLTGSVAEIRVWKGALSASKFKQHILHKRNATGNSDNSLNDIIYRFRLSENHPSGSSGSIKDANYKYNKDYSRLLPFTNIGVYEKEIIDSVKLSPRLDGIGRQDDNMININQSKKIFRNLSPKQRSFRNVYHELENKRKTSTTIEIGKSPTKTVDEYIIANLSDKDISGKIGTPEDLYKDNYTKLKELRRDILKGVKVDINKWLKANKNVFNNSIIESIKKLLPARVKIGSVGAIIKPDILDRSKIKNQRMDIQPQYGLFDMNLGNIPDSWYGFSGSKYSPPYGLDEELSIIDDMMSQSGQYGPIYNTNELDVIGSNLSESGQYGPIYNTNELLYTSNLSESGQYGPIYNTNELDVINFVISSSSTVGPVYSGLVNISGSSSPVSSQSMQYMLPYNATKIDIIDDTLSSSMNYNLPYDGNKLNIITSTISESMYYMPYYNSNTIDYDVEVISHSMTYIPTYIGDLYSKELVRTYDVLTRRASLATGSINVDSSDSGSQFFITGSNKDSVEFHLHALGSDETTPASFSTASITVSSSVTHSDAFYITSSDFITSIKFQVVSGTLSDDVRDTKYFSSGSTTTETAFSASQKINQVFGGFLTAVPSASVIRITSSVASSNRNIPISRSFEIGDNDGFDISGFSGGNISSSIIYFNSSSHQFVGGVRDHYTAISASTKVNTLFNDNWITASVDANNFSTGSITVLAPISHSDAFYITGSDGVTSIQFQVRSGSVPADTSVIKYFLSGSTLPTTALSASKKINNVFTSSQGLWISSSADGAIINISGSFKSNVQGLLISTGSTTAGHITVKGMSTSTTRIQLKSSYTGTSQNKPISGSRSFNTVSGMDSGDIEVRTKKTEVLDKIIESMSMAYIPAYNTNNLSYTSQLSQSAGYPVTINTNKLDIIDEAISESMNYIPYYNSNTIDYDVEVLSHSMKYNPIHSVDLPYTDQFSSSAEFVDILEGTSSEIRDNNVYGQGLNLQGNPYPTSSTGQTRSHIWETWGTSSNDLHFINWASSGSRGDYNTGYYEKTQLFYAIGDVEIQSSSWHYVTCSEDWAPIGKGVLYADCGTPDDFDAGNFRHFQNRLIVDKGKGYTYKSYFGTGHRAGADVDGRPMGATAFIYTSSNGSITYPSNHYRNIGTSKQSIEHLIYEGTQNKSSSGQFLHGLDAKPTASFYTLSVAGSDTENVLKVTRPGNRPTSGRK